VLKTPAHESNTLEIVKVAKNKRELIEITINEDCAGADKTIAQLGLPVDTVVALVVRGENTLIPKGSTCLRADDTVFVITKLMDKTKVERCFYGDGN
jgi:cell volume regulation protein A